MASERSERDTYGGNTIENRGCLDVRMSFCTLTLRIFVFAPRSTPSQTSLNRILPLTTITRITLEIELFTALNSFAGAVKTQKLMGAPFLFELVGVVS